MREEISKLQTQLSSTNTEAVAASATKDPKIEEAL